MRNFELEKERRLEMWAIRAVIVLFVIFVAALLITAWILCEGMTTSHALYKNEDFGIPTYRSMTDFDKDGVDDQTDLLEGARAYIATKPKYKSAYYAGGYPTDGYGVCTDVVAQGFLYAGYDLMELVSEDIALAPQAYSIEKPDPNIDFRRVRNLKVFFDRNAISLTTDTRAIEEWQGGDIVIYKSSHIGIVSDVRNKDGVCLLIHHGWVGQREYEQDCLDYDEIIGHYRFR